MQARFAKVRVIALTLLFIVVLLVVAFLVLRGIIDRYADDLPPALVSIVIPERDPFASNAIENPPFESLTYSVQAFLWWDSHIASIHMDWVQLMSFTHIKQTFAWQDVEPRQDEWHFENADRIVAEMERRNLELVVRLSDAPDWAHPSLPPQAETDLYLDAPADDIADWAEYCGTVAARYQGRVAAYQIWNEPNLDREWGGREPDAAGYVEMLRVCSEAIRSADPNAILISAGLSPTGNHDLTAHRDDRYLQAMYDAGFQQYVDVVGVHAPGFAPPAYGPDDAERDGRGRWATFRRVEDLRKIMIRNEDAARQMAILELGYTTDPRPDSDYAWFAVDEQTQAQYLVDAYQYITDHWRPWIGLVSAIYIPKPTWTQEDEQYWWAITDPEMVELRPAFAALAQMPKYCGDVVIPERTPEESAVALESNPCH